MITMKLDPKDGVETGWKGGGVREHDDWKDNIFFSLSLSLPCSFSSYWLCVSPMKGTTNGSRWPRVELLAQVKRMVSGVCQVAKGRWRWKVRLVTRPGNPMLIQPVAKGTVHWASGMGTDMIIVARVIVRRGFGTSL